MTRRAKRFSEVRRMLVRRLDALDDTKLRELRDELWERLIVRAFHRGRSVEWLASDQPNWGSASRVEAALRSQMWKRRPRS